MGVVATAVVTSATTNEFVFGTVSVIWLKAVVEMKPRNWVCKLPKVGLTVLENPFDRVKSALPGSNRVP